jgi:inorganic triphosphatase YgiF
MAEIELKFELPPEAHAAFRKLPELGAAQPKRARLFALYFDTPRHDLARREMALRLRRSGRAWKQALKAGRSGAGGLHSREEWEYDRPGPSIDLSLYAATPLAGLPRAKKLHESLGEVFRVDIARTTWRVELLPGTSVEVALDRGVVRRGDATETISEVEIESLEGAPLAVFDFAERLLGRVALRPSSVTKAARGYRLASGAKAAPVKAGDVALDGAMEPVEGARATIASALAQLQANEAGVLETRDPEFVHQMRIALRRLRSALRAFRKATGPDLEARVRADLHWITQATGKARDLDVLAVGTLPAMLAAHSAGGTEALVRRLAARRRKARDEVRADLSSERYARLLLELAKWLATPAIGERGTNLREFATGAMKKRHARWMQEAKGVEAMPHAQRHHVRIGAKRLRYVADGFAALYAKKSMNAYLEALSAVQDDLGRANDAAVAERLLRELAAPAPFTAFASGWLASETRSSLENIARGVKRVDRALPWEKR